MATTAPINKPTDKPRKRKQKPVDRDIDGVSDLALELTSTFASLADRMAIDLAPAAKENLTPLSRDEKRILLALAKRDDVATVSNGGHTYADETFGALYDLIGRNYLCLGVVPALGVCRASFVLTKEGRAAAERLQGEN